MTPVETQERRGEGSETFSPAEAAYVAAVSRKTVDQAIDRGEVEPAPSRRPDDSQRAVDVGTIVYFRLREQTGDLLSSEGKRRLYHMLVHRTPDDIPSMITIGAISVRTESALEPVGERLAHLRGVRYFVVSDRGVRGGEPVIRDTRIPVHTIAEMVAQGVERDRILAAYPALTAESLDAAVLYARLHPRRGRPRSAPWRENPPVQVFTAEELGDSR